MARNQEVPFKFGLDPNQPALSKRSDLWSAPLPTTRQAFNGEPAVCEMDEITTYGDYFTCAHDFLSRDKYVMLTQAARWMTGRSVSPADIDGVGLYLLKHGAFYHPAYITLSIFDRCLALVLNVAVSPQGRQVLPREHGCLLRLANEIPKPFWPKVFGRGKGQTEGRLNLTMFLGEWLTGFYEFHLTRQSPAGQLAIEVWDIDAGRHLLRGRPVLDLIRLAAAMLTCAYNPLTFEAIRDWHHAAGDFVIHVAGGQVDMRMISVRDYAPLIRLPEPDLTAVLDGLLLFLITISLRLRLDRQDGIGALAAYPAAVVPAICQGFWHGLQICLAWRKLPHDLLSAAKAYFDAHKIEQLATLAQAVMDNYPATSDDRPIMQALADEHLTVLARSLTAGKPA